MEKQMVDTPAEAAVRRKAHELLARLEHEANDPAEIASRVARRERIRRDAINERLDAASAETVARAARGELTPEQAARREALNAKWQTKYDRPGTVMSDAEFGEMQLLNEIHRRKPPPAPVKPAPHTLASNGKKQMSELSKAVTQAVAREIEAHRRERELQTAKIGEALAKLDAALARAEAGNAKGDRDASQQRFILTR